MTDIPPNTAGNGNDKTPGTALVPVVQPAPIPPPPPPPPATKRIRLGTVREVHRELQRVYREARGGRLPTQTATRLAYLLNLMAQMIVQSDLEARIEVLEQGGRRG